MRVFKICMIGDFGVGKTSLIARFVTNTFSERYLTTVGVKTDTREMILPTGDKVKFVIWDIAGNSNLGSIERNYLRGASGFLLVLDGTRHITLNAINVLKKQAQEVIGEIPFVTLINKSDLHEQWEIKDEDIHQMQQQGWLPVSTSAKNGDGVENAFQLLANELIKH